MASKFINEPMKLWFKQKSREKSEEIVYDLLDKIEDFARAESLENPDKYRDSVFSDFISCPKIYLERCDSQLTPGYKKRSNSEEDSTGESDYSHADTREEKSSGTEENSTEKSDDSSDRQSISEHGGDDFEEIDSEDALHAEIPDKHRDHNNIIDSHVVKHVPVIEDKEKIVYGNEDSIPENKNRPYFKSKSVSKDPGECSSLNTCHDKEKFPFASLPSTSPKTPKLPAKESLNSLSSRRKSTEDTASVSPSNTLMKNNLDSDMTLTNPNNMHISKKTVNERSILQNSKYSVKYHGKTKSAKPNQELIETVSTNPVKVNASNINDGSKQKDISKKLAICKEKTKITTADKESIVTKSSDPVSTKSTEKIKTNTHNVNDRSKRQENLTDSKNYKQKTKITTADKESVVTKSSDTVSTKSTEKIKTSTHSINDRSKRQENLTDSENDEKKTKFTTADKESVVTKSSDPVSTKSTEKIKTSTHSINDRSKLPENMTDSENDKQKTKSTTAEKQSVEAKSTNPIPSTNHKKIFNKKRIISVQNKIAEKLKQKNIQIPLINFTPNEFIMKSPQVTHLVEKHVNSHVSEENVVTSSLDSVTNINPASNDVNTLKRKCPSEISKNQLTTEHLSTTCSTSVSTKKPKTTNHSQETSSVYNSELQRKAQNQQELSYKLVEPNIFQALSIRLSPIQESVIENSVNLLFKIHKQAVPFNVPQTIVTLVKEFLISKLAPNQLNNLRTLLGYKEFIKLFLAIYFINRNNNQEDGITACVDIMNLYSYDGKRFTERLEMAKMLSSENLRNSETKSVHSDFDDVTKLRGSRFIKVFSSIINVKQVPQMLTLFIFFRILFEFERTQLKPELSAHKQVMTKLLQNQNCDGIEFFKLPDNEFKGCFDFVETCLFCLSMSDKTMPRSQETIEYLNKKLGFSQIQLAPNEGGMRADQPINVVQPQSTRRPSQEEIPTRDIVYVQSTRRPSQQEFPTRDIVHVQSTRRPSQQEIPTRDGVHVQSTRRPSQQEIPTRDGVHVQSTRRPSQEEFPTSNRKADEPNDGAQVQSSRRPSQEQVQTRNQQAGQPVDKVQVQSHTWRPPQQFPTRQPQALEGASTVSSRTVPNYMKNLHIIHSRLGQKLNLSGATSSNQQHTLHYPRQSLESARGQPAVIPNTDGARYTSYSKEGNK